MQQGLIERFLVFLSEKSHDVFWIRNTDYSEQIYINPAFDDIWQRNGKELYHHPEKWLTYLHPKDKLKLVKSLQKRNSNAKSGDDYIEEYRIVRPSGEIRYIYDHSFAIFDQAGKHIGFAGIATDITEQKIYEKSLKEEKIKAETASQAKSEFIANMSHDIRTPITGMMGMIQSMLNTAEQIKTSLQDEQTGKIIQQDHTAILKHTAETFYQDNQLLMTATEELLTLCNEILEVINLESGKVKAPSESFNLHQMITHNVELLKPVARHKALQLSYDIDSALPVFVVGIRSYLDRALLNVISNALKFTQEGFVKVSAQLMDKPPTQGFQPGDALTLQVEVEDSGIGIPKDKFKTIFKHFSRLTPSYEGIYKGTGLGLYTVKRYVKAMKGHIELTSVVGQGSCFTIKIPLIVAQATTAAEVIQTLDSPLSRSLEPTLEVVAPPSTPTVGKVLLVEDNPIVSKVTLMTLESFQCSTDLAKTGQQAVDMAGRGDYDLILMDIGLPDFNGIEATRQIRAFADEQRSRVPIVAVTGHANNPAMRQEALEVGMQEVLTKPVKTLVLEAIFNQFVFKNTTKKAGHPKAKASEVKEIIDWDACFRIFANDREKAWEFLLMLVDELKITQDRLTKSYDEQDLKGLRYESQRALSGTCYFKLPQLNDALTHLHETVKSGFPDPHCLKKAYKEAQKAIEAFWGVMKEKPF